MPRKSNGQIVWTNARRRLRDLKPWEKNPRQIRSDQARRLLESLEEFGQVLTFAIGPKNELYDGHQRDLVWAASEKYGPDFEVDVRVASRPLTEAERKKLAIYLHEGTTGEWNFDILANHFDLGELIDWGFDRKKLDPTLWEPADQPADAGAQLEQIEELRAKWQTAPGQLWQFGLHRLLIDDCQVAVNVERLMAGKRAILFATDPPYLVGYDGKNHPHVFGSKDKNKDWSGYYGDVNWDESNATGDFSLYDNFIRAAIDVALLPNAAWYLWHASRNQAAVEAIWEKFGAFVHQQIVWVKDRPILTRSWYMWQHEPCFFGWQRGHEPPRRSNDYPPGVWNIPTVAPGTKTLHPTSKPIEIFEIPMRQHTMTGDICYEPFAGSGSQFIAGERLQRAVYGLEISPIYAAVCLERWSQTTGGQPQLVDN